jgi:hypothetical protein
MILAGLTLLAIGVADLIRQFASPRGRTIGFVVAAVAFFAASIAIDAAVWAIGALLAAALWVLFVRSDGRSRSGLWPVGLLGVVCGVAVVIAGARATSLAFGRLWELPAPGAAVPVDLLVLTLGAAAFLLESANTVVRTALRAEQLEPAADASTAGDDSASPEGDAAPSVRPRATLKGGRLIGPLERVIVFALMLAGAYTLIAAVFAAKGIVRFPEISRDGEGDRAEMFLIGSLVSWVLAFAAAFLVWWAGR